MAQFIKDHHRFFRPLVLNDQKTDLDADDGITTMNTDQFVVSTMMANTENEDCIQTIWAYPAYDASLRLRTGVDTAVNDWSISIDSSDTTNDPLVFTNRAALPGTPAYDVLKIHSDGKLVFSNGESIDNLVDTQIRISAATLKTGLAGYLTLTDNEIDVSSGNLDIDVASNIKLNADGGKIEFADGGAPFPAASIGISEDSYSEFLMNEKGGATEDDYFRIRCEDDGETTIITKDTAGIGGAISIIPDGVLTLSTVGSTSHLVIESGRDMLLNSVREILMTTTLGNITMTPIAGNGKLDLSGTHSIRERAASLGDITGSGQLWVKNDAPNNLYFTDDTGQDVPITNDGSLAITAGNTAYISRLHRWGASADNKYYGGYQGGYSRTAELYGLTSEIDASMYGWPAVKYSDFMAPAPGTIVNFNGVAQQDTASSDVALSLFKVTITDNDSITGGQVVDFIGKIQWAANVDTTSIHALHTHGGLDPTAAHFNAGDILVVGFSRESGSDAVYYWIRYTVEFQYD